MILRFCLVIFLCSIVPTVHASQWVEPGTTIVRHDIDVLARHGLISGPIISWPVPKAQVERRLEQVSPHDLPIHVQKSLERVRRWLRADEYAPRPGVRLRLAATNQPRIVGHFQRPIRDDFDTSLWLGRDWRSTTLRVGVGYHGASIDKMKFDGSYLVQAVSGWLLYGGIVDLWWGPGRGNSIILSTNAQALPKIGWMRRDPRAFKTRWLKWMGPWQFNGFAGVLDDDRHVADPLLVGLQLVLNPVRGLEVGLTRVFTICGSGRSCGLSTWADAAFPFNDVENQETANDPSNQIAGFDLRYNARVGRHGAAIYGQYYGEDEQDNWIRSVIGMFGLSVDGPLGRGGTQWRVTIEYSETAVDGFEDRPTVFNQAYGHRVYRTGYRYRQRAIGHSIDGDGRLASLMASVFDTQGNEYYARYHFARINRDDACGTINGVCQHTVSESAEEINTIEAGVVLPTKFGDVAADVRWASDRPNSSGKKDPSGTLRFSWERRF